jgi:hypothetical protein
LYLRLFVASSVVLAAAGSVFGQTGSKEPGEPLGQMFSPRVFDLAERGGIVALDGAAPQPRVYHFFAAPLFVDFDGGSLLGGTLGYKDDWGKPIQLKFSYNRISVDGAGDAAEQLAGNFKVEFWTTADQRLTMSAIADYKHTDKVENVKGTLAAEYLAWQSKTSARKIIPLVNLSWARRAPDGADSVKAAQVSMGVLTFLTSSVLVNAEYVFENDIAGDDSYALTAILVLPAELHKAKVITGYEKGDSVFVNLSFPF